MHVGPRSLDDATLSIAVPVALPPKMRTKCRELSKLRVPLTARGKGLASRLLARVLAEADETKTPLFLHCEADGGLTQQALAQFYARYGFDPIQASPLLMLRLPHAG